VLPDSAIIAAAEANPSDERELLALPGFGGRSVRRLAPVWLDALSVARDLGDGELPQPPTADGPPPPHRWAERDPEAAARLARCREVVTRTAHEYDLPPENLVAPDAIRRLAWTPPDPLDEPTVRTVLAGLGVRAWQLSLLAAQLTTALAEPPAQPPPTGPPPSAPPSAPQAGPPTPATTP
jgi:ribonuclease D